MTTKLFKSMNFIRCVSGANLNLFRFTAILLCLLALGIGNAWAGDSYYAEVTANPSPTGAGSVYVSYNSNTKGASNKATGADQQNTVQNFYLYAVTAYGYSWGNWTAGQVPSGGSQEFTQTTTKEGALFKARTKNSDGTLSYTVTANFNRRSIEAAGAVGNDMSVQTWKAHSGTTITLEDKYALKNTDVPLTYSPAAIGGLSPNASWTIGKTNDDSDGAAITNGKWTVVLAYDFANPTALVHNLSQSLTVSEAVAVQSKTVAVPLDLTPVFTIPDGYAFPELAVGSTDTHSFAPSDYGDLPIGNAKLTWTAELTGENADQFHINSTTPTNGEVTVTFAPTAAQSSAAAVVLTATWQDASGANISYSQIYNLHGDTPLDYEARVISSSGEELFTGDFMDAVPVANANENCTLQLVNDVEVTSSIEFTKSITLDLYSKELRRTGIAAASQLILLNTAGKLLTITDSKPGALGTLYAAGNANAQLQAVKVANGSVVMSNCKVYVENTNTNGTEKTLYAIGVYVATGKSFTMTGGTITANRTGGRNGYGVYAEKTSTVELTNVTIDVAAPSYAYGIVSDGSLTITNVHSTATAPTCTYGIYPTANATAVINSGSFTAHSTNGNIARAIINVGNTAIMDGTFTALVDNGTTATAAYATAGILAIKKGTFSATASATTAYGIHLNGGSSRAVVYGGIFTGLANGATSTTAAGARVENTSVLEATAGTFSGIVDRSGLTAATNVNSYGLLLLSGGTANVSGATLKAENKQNYSRYAYGVSSAGALSLSNCQIEAKSPYQYNMGINITGNTATIRDCNVNAYSTAGAYNYGIYVNAAAAIANVENTDFTINSYTTYAYGANVNNGTLNATNCTFDVTAQQATATKAANGLSYGVFVNTGKTAHLNGCAINAKTPKASYAQYAYGVYTKGITTIDDCIISATSAYRYAYALRGESTASLDLSVNSGKFKTSVPSAQVAYHAPIYRDETKGKTVVYGGFFDKNTNLDYYVADGYGINPLNSDRTEYAEGYRYVVEATSEQGNYVCKIGNTKYRTLEEALQYANQNTETTLTILMTANYKLPAGDYVLPPKATLLIPYAASQTTAKKNNLERITTTGSRTPYLVLTFEDGVHFSAKGSIEVGGRQYSGGGSNTGCVADNYGKIVLEGDARIDMENNASLYAWGYITGTGMVNVKSGSQVYEMFVMGDWKGGAQAYALYSDKKAFLVSHYFYQNIEANVLYRPGAKAYGSSTVYASSSIQDVDDVEMIGPEGSEAMFTMDPATESADTYVKKIYHPNTDRLEFVLNSGANLNALSITAMGYEFPASKYILPICSNITITLAEGDIRVNQNFYFMPGSILNILKEATFIIPSGKSIYFYDGDDNDFSHTYTSGQGTSSASTTSTIYKIGYTPSFVTNPRSNSLWPDAEMFVHGKVEVSGNLYTTTHGANIHSTNADAGKITFYSVVPNSTSATINQHTGGSGSGFSGTSYYTSHSLTSAQLKNDVSYEGTDDEYSATAGTQANETWVYIEGKWTKLSEEGCFNTRTAGSTKQYFIHAGDAVEVDYPARADHAYKATNAERYFINAEDCMWWEAELQTIGGVEYYVANQEKYDNYGTCYYYDAATGYWKPKYVTVAWNIQTLSGAKTITYTDVPLNTRPKYNSENPAKPGDGTADFVWTGWENVAGNTYSKTDVLPIATGDVTYTAVFERRPYIYTVAFLNPDGSPISGKKYEAGQIPVAPEVPIQTPTAAIEYEFTGWDKPIVAVTGPTEYTAVYVSHPRKYNVTFYDLDGKTVLQTSKVEYNTMPSYSGAIPNHSDKYYTYVFDGWSPEIIKVTGDANYTARYNTTKNKYTVTFQNPNGSVVDQQLLDAGSTPVAPSNPTMEAVDKIYTFTGWDKAISEVTEDVTYTASYTSATRTYTIRFINWNNVELKKDAVAYGSTPTLPADPSKPSDAENDYMFSGWTPNVTSVSGDATYRATFSETKKKYTILFQNPKGTTLSNPASVDNKWEYGSTPEYTGITPTKSTDALYSYEFKEWTPTITAVTGDKTYIADFTATIRKFTVTWDANGGWCGTASTNVRGGDAVGGMPVTTREGYEFEGWFTEAIGGSQISAETVITADITYHAHWTLLTYDFTIAATPAGYGTVSAPSVAEVPYGTAVTENGNNITVNGTTIIATPAATTAQYTYAFSQWAYVPATVTGNVSIEAVFTRTVNQYTVLWKSEDGTSTIESDVNQNYGAVTAFNGTTPTKDATAQYTYTFDGWATEANGEKVYENDATPTVSGAATYYAHFAQTTNAYTVTWKNADGTELEKDEDVLYGTTPEYNGETPTQTATATDVYTFAGWDSEIAAVTGNITYTATYTSVAPVASVTVGGATTYYNTIDAAFDYMNLQTSSTELKLLQDVTATDSLVYTPAAAITCTLDLNNHILSGSMAKLFVINLAGSTFVVTDKSAEKEGKILNNYNYNIRVYAVVHRAGTFKLQAGTIRAVNPHKYSSAAANKNSAATGVYFTNGYTFTMDGGKIESECQYASYGLQCKKGTSTVTINNGEISAHTTASTTAYGIYTQAKGLTINNGTIKSFAKTSKSYAVYLNGGTATINGGYIEAANDTVSGGTTSVYGIYALYSNTTYTGKLTIPSTSTVKVKAVANTTTAVAVFTGGGGATKYASVIQAGEFIAYTKTGKTAYGVYNQGHVKVSDGKFKVTSATTDAYGIICNRGTATVSGTPEFTVKATTSTAVGVLASGLIPSKGGTSYSGNIEVNGGKFNVSTGTSTSAMGAYASVATKSIWTTTSDSVPGNYAYAGTMTITAGEFNVTSYGSTSYALICKASTTQKKNTELDPMTATPKLTVTGGKFILQSNNGGNTTCYASNDVADAEDLLIQGGYYSSQAISSTQNLGDKYTAPMKDCNYHSLQLTAEECTAQGMPANSYEVAEACTITFKDGEAVLQSGLVKKGATPYYSGIPEKAETPQYSYEFSGWSPAITAVTADATYTAQFSSTVNKYDITWVDGNGATLKTEQVEYGQTPAYTGATPTKTATDQYTYTFNNTWSPAIVAVTGAATYTAQFGSTVNEYTITWVDGNGETLKTEQVAYGQTPAYTGATPTKTATAQYTCTFNNTWSPAIVSVTGDATYTAQFGSTVNEYTITWVDGNGETLKTEQVAYGQTPAYTGATPTKTATDQYTYTFNNTWSPAIVSVTGDATYTAQFGSTVNKYDIMWVDGDGVTLKTEQVEYGQTPAYTGDTPTKTATAQYTYTFNNTWSPAIVSVTGAATYTALFDEAWRKYSITWRGEGITERTDQVEYGTKPEYGILPTKDPTVQQVFTYKWMNVANAVIGVKPVTGDATYEGSFTGSPRPYTITFVNDDNTTLQSSEVGYGSTPSYGGSTPESSHTGDGNNYTFVGWAPEITVVGEAMTYTAVYNCAVDPIVVVADETKTVAINTTTTTTTVEVKGKLNVAADKTLTTDDLILEGTPSSSGEITGEGTVAATRALFHFSQPGGFKERTWYAVAVPWQVDVPAYQLGGVYIKKGEGEYVQQTLGSTFDLIYYNGELRATGASKAWNYVENDPAADRIMVPGRAYMIYLVSDADTIRFERKADAPLHTNSLKTKKYAVSEGVNSDYADWNGIANPATYHAYLNVGATEGKGQVYNPDTKQYEMFNMSSNKLVVGQPIFVQPQTAKTVVASDTYGTYSPAPRRAKAEESMTRYELYLAPSMDVATDRIIVRMSEDKETDEYIVGQDLAKMGVSSLVPQMWVDRYDSKMCINTAIPTDDQAYYPLGISVPQNGEYDIFLDDEPDSESTLYLTYDGEVIWNLSYGFYVAHLEKGTNTHYGLRIVKTPKVATGIDNAETSGKDINVYKIIVDDKVFIIRGNQVYGIDGRLAK